MFTSSTTSDHYTHSIGISPMQLTTKWRYNNVEVAPNCPRCASSNTKFCYYNNYSLSQPRYFCKACRRYWTKGGSLRNVPVGGGCRKSRRARAACRQPGVADTVSPASADGSSNGGACIDMAAVFAKYVNQNLENEETSSFSTGSSSDNQLTVDSQFEDINNSALGLDPVVPQMDACQDLSGQQFVYSGFELQQGVLCDELWAEGTTLPNLGPMVQEEDCGLFAADYDQLRISANLVSDDNWGSFDLSAYDFYSTP